jgi:hypothetical protein
LHQQRAQQLLGRDRRTAVLGLQRGKLDIEGFQRLIGDATDQAQRVIVGDPALRSNVAEKSVPPNVVATHPKPPPMSIQEAIESDALASQQGVFQQPAREIRADK